ncbi:MAG: SpoIIIAH-like family protein [Oscillospiraceae bacterium]|nr:SpoIIIAH-like family protein [Oscillospiraceae bacterium]
MKSFKRNAVIVTVLIFVCVAVYLNWSYTQAEVSAGAKSGKSVTADEENAAQDTDTAEEDEAEAGGLYFVPDGTAEAESSGSAASEYFDQVRLSREQARDSAKSTLQTITETDGADKAAVDEAMATMVSIAKRTEEEARLESLVIAKGFKDCVAYMTDDGVTVTVPSDEQGLSESAVARIKDIVLSETAYSADQLKIIEIRQ